ncbi:MAG: TfoX/Sxy family protein [Stellaceae bacterium]
MPKPPDPIAEFVCDQLSGWAPVAARRLFGGWGIYDGAVMFGLIARDTIYFRVDDLNRPDYLAAAMPPFVHTARRRAQGTGGKFVAMPYYEVPPAALDDPAELAPWAGKAHAAALRAATAKTRRLRKAKPAFRARPR